MGQYPINGVIQLQDGVLKDFKERLYWAKALHTRDIRFTFSDYNKFTGCLLAAIYSFAVNGRPQALQSMTLGAFLICWKQNRPAESCNFKTAGTFGTQVITVEKGVPTELMKAYIEIVRPAAVDFLLSRKVCIRKRGIQRFAMICTYIFSFLFVPRSGIVFVIEWRSNQDLTPLEQFLP